MVSYSNVVGGFLSLAAGIFIFIGALYYIEYVYLLHSIMGWLLHLIFAILVILGAVLALKKSKLACWLVLSGAIFTISFALVYNFTLLPFFRPYSFFLVLTDVLDLSTHLWVFGIPIEAILLLLSAIILLFNPNR